MPEEVSTHGSVTVIINADHRNGICEKCLVKMEVRDVPFQSSRLKEGETVVTEKLVKRPVCPKCGGMAGQLIAKPISMQAPNPPHCIHFRCICKFIMDSLYAVHLSLYHKRRVAYAEKNRPERKTIQEKYRTGDPAPENLWQAIVANFKLSFLNN